MTETNWAVLAVSIVAGVAIGYARSSPGWMRRVAAILIRQAVRVEAARTAAKIKGDAAYEEACQYLEIKGDDDRAEIEAKA